MSEMSVEDQHIHEIVERHTEFLRDEIKRLRIDFERLEQQLTGIRRDVHNGFEMPQ